MSKSRVHNGVKHGPRCKCAMFCDPGDTALKAARAAYLHEQKLRKAGVLPPTPEPARFGPPRRARPIAPSTDPAAVRFRELLRQGVTAQRALEIIDAETKGTP